jgi:cation transport regulator ChaC
VIFDSKMIYFAYGSNMSTGRLRHRVPSCQRLAIARLLGYELRFHKRSIDGSGKCNAFHTGNENVSVIGVVFEMSKQEKEKLDRSEGLGSGYHEQIVRVGLMDGALLDAMTYVADDTHINESLRPYSWYKDFVAAGAEEQRLPTSYVDKYITSVPASSDPNRKREQARRAEVK